MEISLYYENPITRSQDNIVRGLASVYWAGNPGEECQPFGDDTYERIAPGAWEGCKMDDVMATKDHIQTDPLGRTPNKLQLFTTKRGLEFQLAVSQTTCGRDTLTLVDDLIIRGCSFIAKPDLKSITRSVENGKKIVTINKFKVLKEITLCSKPYYTAATIARSQGFHNEVEAYAKTQVALSRIRSLNSYNASK